MGQPFPQEVTPGGVLVYPSVKSPNYVHNSAGWSINVDGSAEFNNLQIRGTFNGTDFILNSTGAFFYSGTPASGNLVLSIVPGTSSVTDPEGNVAPPGMTVGEASTTQLQLVSSAGIGQLIMLLNNAGFANGVLESAVQSGYASVILNGPKNTTTGFTDLVGMILNSSDGVSSFSNLGFNYTDNAGTRHQYAYIDGSGFHITTGSITAVEPGTGTGQGNPAFNEAWHNITMDSGWSSVSGYPAPRYRLLPDGNAQLDGLAQHASFTTATSLNLSNALPSAYRLAGYGTGTDAILKGATAGPRACVQMNASGVIYATPDATYASYTYIDLSNCIYTVT